MPEFDYLTVEGQNIYLRREGAGKPLILLHCSSSHSGQWTPLMEAAAGKFASVAPDLHGYGRSDKLPRDCRPYFERDSAIVAALIEQAGEPVHLVGHSLGGTVALHSALRWPEKIASLTVIEPVQFSVLEETGFDSAHEMHEIATMMTANMYFDEHKAAAQAFVEFWSGQGAWDGMKPHVQEYITATIDRVMQDWVGTSQIAPGQMRLADLTRLNMPFHIIRGTASRRSAWEISGCLFDHASAAKMTEIEGASHMDAALRPEAINKKIMAFVESVAIGVTAG